MQNETVESLLKFALSEMVAALDAQDADKSTDAAWHRANAELYLRRAAIKSRGVA